MDRKTVVTYPGQDPREKDSVSFQGSSGVLYYPGFAIIVLSDVLICEHVAASDVKIAVGL
jgi:hypothetical protein